jgi:hypothetical protein
VIVRTDCAGYHGRSTGAQADRDTRYDHEDWKRETQRSKFANSDTADKPHVDEGLPHHREDAE